jgi:ankyrin repeat protein
MRITTKNDKNGENGENGEIHQSAKRARIATKTLETQSSSKVISLDQLPAMDVDTSTPIEKKSAAKTDADTKTEINRDKFTPLHAAAQNGDIDTFSSLLKQQNIGLCSRVRSAMVYSMVGKRAHGLYDFM